jgi:hypothetical protein
MKATLVALALTLVVFIGGFVWSLVSGGKATDEALRKALDEYIKSKETK